MIDRQNIVSAPEHQNCVSAPSAFLDLSQSRVTEKRKYDDEESRVSTDSDPYLDSEEEDLDVDDYRTTYSTFSVLLIRRLQALQEKQDSQEDENSQADGPIRPPLLTTADDSFIAKMDRVKRWARSVSTAPSEAASARDYSPPPVVTRKRRLSDASSPEDISVKRARISDTPSLVPDSPLLSSTHLYPQSQYTTSSAGSFKKISCHLMQDTIPLCDPINTCDATALAFDPDHLGNELPVIFS